MRQLRGIADNTVMLLGCCELNSAEARFKKKVSRLFSCLNACFILRSEKHCGTLVKVCSRMSETRKLCACHGVTADKLKAVFIRNRIKLTANHSFCAAAIYDDCAFFKLFGIIFYKIYNSLRICRDNNKIALAYILVTESTVNRADKLCGINLAELYIIAQNGMLCIFF